MSTKKFIVGFIILITIFTINLGVWAEDFSVFATFGSKVLMPNQTLTATVTATNWSSQYYSGKIDVLVIVGLYDANNTMVNFSYISKGIPYHGTEKLQAGFRLQSDVVGYTARAFMWDGTDLKTTNLTPLSNVEQITATNATYFGVSDYGTVPGLSCSFGSRAGRQYCENLSAQLSAANPNPSKKVDTLNMCTDSGAYASKAASLASSADLFVYSGHGLRYDKYSSLNNNAQLHFYASSPSDTWHTVVSEDKTEYNLGWNEISFSERTKWSIFYTCNWLTNGGDSNNERKMYNLFHYNLHLMCGFASRIYLDSREGTVLGDYLRDFYTIKQAFFSAAQIYQPQLDPSGGTDGKVYAKVMGATSAENDMFDSYSTVQLPGYSSSPASYSSWSIGITCTGR